MNIKSRPVYFSLMSLMFRILDMLEGAGDSRVSYYRYIVLSDAFVWFSMTPMYVFWVNWCRWGDVLAIDKPKMIEFYNLVKQHNMKKDVYPSHMVFCRNVTRMLRC
jgi:hypothetical protein